MGSTLFCSRIEALDSSNLCARMYSLLFAVRFAQCHLLTTARLSVLLQSLVTHAKGKHFVQTENPMRLIKDVSKTNLDTAAAVGTCCQSLQPF